MQWGPGDSRLYRFITSIVLAIFALTAQTAQAQSSTYTVTSEVALVEPLTLVNLSSLDFGSVAATTAAGTVTMTPTASPTCAVAGGIAHFGTCQPAEFLGYGATGMVFRVKLPVGRQTTITGPGGSILIDNMTVDGNPELVLIQINNSQGFVRYRIASANGIFHFRVGGRLNVNANQLPGTYSGTFDIRIDYQ